MYTNRPINAYHIDHSWWEQEAQEWLLENEIKNGKKSKPWTDNAVKLLLKLL